MNISNAIEQALNEPNYCLSIINKAMKIAEHEHMPGSEFMERFRAEIHAMKSAVQNIYERKLKSYKRYKEEDKKLPLHKKNNYPKPNINDTAISKYITSTGTEIKLHRFITYAEIEFLSNAVENGQPIRTESEFLLIKPLTEQQYQMLLDYVNKHRLFKTPIDLSTMQALFTGKLTQPLQVSNNIKIACFFEALATKFISAQWQSIIGRSGCLIGTRNKLISSSNLAKSHHISDESSDYFKEIHRLVNTLLK